ncbi:MAG: LamG-like jellyroll fold domain-containing protein, partial [Verrucomicrobiota bacterium]
TDTALPPGQSYTYAVKARDKSAAQNETATSVPGIGIIDAGINSLIARDLLAYWPFDEISGIALSDESGLGHDGIAFLRNTNVYPQWVSGKLDGASQLFTNSEYQVGNGFIVDSGGPDLPAQFTIAFWIRPDGASNLDGILVQWGENSGYTWRVRLDGANGVQFNGAGVTDFESSGLSDLTWTHVVLTWDGVSGHRRFLMDGEVAFEDYGAHPVQPADVLPAERAMLMGCFSQTFPSTTNNLGQNFLSASLDDMAIWGRVLEASEIAWLYNSSTGRSLLSSDQGDAALANFTPSPDSAVAPATISFIDQSAGIPDTWLWDFDSDGSLDAGGQYPQHTYSSPGIYTARLTVVRSGISNSFERVITLFPASDADLGSKWFISLGAPPPPAPWNHWNPSSVPLGTSLANVLDDRGGNPISVEVTEIVTGGSMQSRREPGNDLSGYIGWPIFGEPTPSNVLAGCWRSHGLHGALELTFSNLAGSAEYQVATFAYGATANVYWDAFRVIDANGQSYMTNHAIGYIETPGDVTSQPNGTLILRYEDPVPRHSGVAAIALFRYYNPLVIDTIQVTPTNIALNWHGGSGRVILDRCTSLISNDWSYVGDILTTNLVAFPAWGNRAYFRIREVETMTIPDPNFEAVIRSEITIKYSPTNLMYDIDVDRLNTLDASSAAISNLTGISAFSGLMAFRGDNNQLSGSLDLSSNPHLIYVDVTNNLLTEIILHDTNHPPPALFIDGGVTVRGP